MDLNVVADALSHSSSKATDWSGRCHIIGIAASVLAIALLSAGVVSATASGWFTVSGASIVGCGLWLSKKAQGVNWRARFIRRRALLTNSIGYGDALAEGLDLITDSLTDERLRSVPKEDRQGYYSSNASEGIERLRENLVESAIWTEKLYRAAKAQLLIKSLVIVVCAIGMAATIVFARKGAIDTTAALQLVSVALVFVVSAEQFDNVERWKWASGEARRLRQALTVARHGDSDQQAAVRVWVAFSDYAVLTSIAPAIPRRLYQRYGAELSAASAAILDSGRMPKNPPH